MIPEAGRRARGRRVELLVAGLVGAGVLALAAVGASVIVATLTAVGGLSPGAGVAALLSLLVAVVLLGVVGAGLAVGLVVAALSRLRDAVAAARRRLLWRLYRAARELEEGTLLGRLLRPTRAFAPDGEGPLLSALKGRYVAGDLDEFEFERELDRLLGDGATAGRRVGRHVEAAGADGADGADGGAPGAGTDPPPGGAPDERLGERERERERERG